MLSMLFGYILVILCFSIGRSQDFNLEAKRGNDKKDYNFLAQQWGPADNFYDIFPKPLLEILGESGFLWMEACWDHLSSKALVDMVLPGSHDSVSYNLGKEMDKKETGAVAEIAKVAEKLHLPVWMIARPWSTCQVETMMHQLQAGIRYFDMRVVWDGHKWRLGHFLIGESLEAALDDVIKFISTTKKEVVVLDFNHVHDSPLGHHTTDFSLKRLQKYVETKLGKYSVERAVFPSPMTTPLQQLVDAKTKLIVLIVGDEKTLSPRLFPSSLVHNSWADSANVHHMRDFNQRQVKEFCSADPLNHPHKSCEPHCLMKISWTLTPQLNLRHIVAHHHLARSVTCGIGVDPL
eukprot:Platyproteum_vivax@DN7256_c0_g2_i1.p1